MLTGPDLSRESNRMEDSPNTAAYPLWWRLAPYLLALFFAAWALRWVEANNVVDTDAARHAMNGAFIRDLVANGQITHPIQYGKFYYGHLPALSMPFHPPMFPLIESVFFAIFGVNVLAARLAIALATAVSVFLLYRLIVSMHGSPWMALAVTASFGFWKEAQVVAGDVMLEYPAMVFTLGALLALRGMIEEDSLGRSLVFAVLAAAAVWTKQQAIFLAGVPFLYAVLAGKWRFLLRKNLWIATAILLAAAAALSALALPFKGTGMDQVSVTYDTGGILLHNLRFYAGVFRLMMGAVPAVLLACAFLAALLGPRRRQNAFYLAWVITAFGLLLLIVPFSARYLFFGMPAAILIAYNEVFWVAERLIGHRYAWCAPAAAALVCSVAGLLTPAIFMRGPSEAAAALVNGQARRVLYCGSADGNFVFAVRARDPKLNTVVISGDKLPASVLNPAGFDRFVQEYGVNDVIIERTARAQPCDSVAASPPASLTFDRAIPLDSSRLRWKGKLLVYHAAAPGTTPPRSLKVAIPRIGSDVEVKF